MERGRRRKKKLEEKITEAVEETPQQNLEEIVEMFLLERSRRGKARSSCIQKQRGRCWRRPHNRTNKIFLRSRSSWEASWIKRRRRKRKRGKQGPQRAEREMRQTQKERRRGYSGLLKIKRKTED